jgi:hypothetical protein
MTKLTVASRKFAKAPESELKHKYVKIFERFLMCTDVTETDKEISFNSGKPHSPRRFRNCTVANVKARVTSNIFQHFVRRKNELRWKTKICDLYIQFQIF